MGQIIKYGQVMGPCVNLEFPVAASEIFKHLGGAFVKIDANNRVAIAGATDTAIIGWANTGDFTASSTAGQTKVPVNISLDAVYRMRLDAAQTETQLKGLIGETCDMIVTSNIQYADVDASAQDVLLIVGYEYLGSGLGEQTVLVKLYHNNLTVKGGVA